MKKKLQTFSIIDRVYLCWQDINLININRIIAHNDVCVHLNYRRKFHNTTSIVIVIQRLQNIL